MLDKTKQYAIDKHRAANHKYDGLDYDFHLNMVYETALDFIHLVEEGQRENVLAGCWVHDIIEDARETYNDVKKETNHTIAELAYALTNEKGKTRGERANDRYYQGIRETKYASFIKFCDRIANVTHSRDTGSRMLDKYRAENEHFISKIHVPGCEALADHLRGLFEE